MDLAPHLHIEWVDDEAVILDTETGHLHYLNPPAALALALIAEHGLAAAADQLRSSHGQDPQKVDEEFADFLREMLEKGVLVE
jgi:hypothetical protein